MFKLNNKKIIILFYVIDFDCYEFVFISEDRLLIKKELLIILRMIMNELLLL